MGVEGHLRLEDANVLLFVGQALIKGGSQLLLQILVELVSCGHVDARTCEGHEANKPAAGAGGALAAYSLSSLPAAWLPDPAAARAPS